MPTRAFLIGLAALAACSPPSDNSPKPPPSSSSTPFAPAPADIAPLDPIGDFAGEYRVAGINDAPIDAPVGLALSISDRRILFDGPCRAVQWDYQFEGTRIRTVCVTAPDGDCGATPQERDLASALIAALDKAVLAGRTPSNGIALSGGGLSVTLYSQ